LDFKPRICYSYKISTHSRHFHSDRYTSLHRFQNPDTKHCSCKVSLRRSREEEPLGYFLCRCLERRCNRHPCSRVECDKVGRTHKRDQRINDACDRRVRNVKAPDNRAVQRTALAAHGIKINAALIVDTSAQCHIHIVCSMSLKQWRSVIA
jgi:hypothetical protein